MFRCQCCHGTYEKAELIVKDGEYFCPKCDEKVDRIFVKRLPVVNLVDKK